MSRNILAVYSRATAEETARGNAWYPTAARGCEVWSQAHGIDARTVASVIAALSPQCEWTMNLRHALNMLSGDNLPIAGPSQPLQANVRKARAILADRALSPDAYFIEGFKVKAFARNLQGDLQAVTVDTHAGQIALNDVSATPRLDHLSTYAPFADAYRKAARLLNMPPSAVQAVSWLVWKRLYAPGVKRAIRRITT